MLSLIFGAILLFFSSWICLCFSFKPPDEGYEAFFLYLASMVGGCAVDVVVVVDDNGEEIIYYLNV